MVIGEKKKIELNGRVQYPVITGQRAVIFDEMAHNAITTSIVQEIELISANNIVIETMNSRYIVCLNAGNNHEGTFSKKKWFRKN